MVQKSNIIELNKGKTPPQAIDLEEAVIGAMIIDKDGLNRAIELLTSDVFYKESNKFVFESIVNIFNRNEGVDLLTVSSELKKTSKLELVGGDFYLIELTQKVSSSAHIEYHSRILLQKYIQRKCIKVSSNMIEDSYNEDVDVFELLEKAYKEFGEVTDLITVGKDSNFKENVVAYLNSNKKNNSGIKSCLTLLNKKLNGFQNSDLIVLGGRPGSGKTAYALNEIIECGLRGIPVAFLVLK